jgi:hypothetical protein
MDWISTVQDWIQLEVVVAHGALNLVQDGHSFATEWLSAILEYLWSMYVVTWQIEFFV